MTPEFSIEIIRTLNNKYFWQIRTKNRRVIAKSLLYTGKQMCERTAWKLEQSLDCGVKFIDLNKDYDKYDDNYDTDDKNMFMKEKV